MRIVNLAHGNLYAFGAYVTAWVVGTQVARLQAGGREPSTFLLLALLPAGALAAAAVGALLEPTLLRPFYRRAEEYQLLVTFGLLLILEDAIRFFWGGLPLTADPLMDAIPSIAIGNFIYPGYYLVVI